VHVRIPNLEKITLKRDPYTDYIETALHHATIPVDRRVLTDRALGIKPGEPIHFFAHGKANWPAALAKIGERQKTLVYCSDGSAIMVEKARSEFPRSGIAEFQVADALTLPKTETRGWLVSFEPRGLTHLALPIAILRALALSKGVKIIESLPPKTKKGSTCLPPIHEYGTEFFGRYYEAETDSRIAKITCQKRRLDQPAYRTVRWFQFWRKRKAQHVIITLHTTETGREKARADLKMLQYLQDKTELDLENAKTAKEIESLGLTAEQARSSLRRLNELSHQLGFEERRSFGGSAALDRKKIAVADLTHKVSVRGTNG